MSTVEKIIKTSKKMREDISKKSPKDRLSSVREIFVLNNMLRFWLLDPRIVETLTEDNLFKIFQDLRKIIIYFIDCNLNQLKKEIGDKKLSENGIPSYVG